jgi:hypothetical protein
MRNEYKISVVKSRRINHLGDIVVDGKAMLK